jgi:hypothetical protein
VTVDNIDNSTGVHVSEFGPPVATGERSKQLLIP